MLQTLERTNIFDARVLTAAHADALRALAGPGGLPLLPCLHPALEEGQIVGDYAGQDELQAAAALLPLYAGFCKAIFEKRAADFTISNPFVHLIL